MERLFSKRICFISVVCFVLAMAATAGAADYPFYDDMESGSGNWSGDTPWSLVESSSHTPANSWTDSEEGYYANNQDISLTLASSLDLGQAVAPRLVFHHRYQLEAAYDFGYVEVSTDNWTTWSQVAVYTGIRDEEWSQEQIDLSHLAGQTQVRIRFRLVTDKTIVMDGWHIDDVAVAEAPHEVTLLSVENPTYQSLDLTWTLNLDGDFACYKIYRNTTPDVSPQSTLVTTLTDQAATSFTDTGLLPEVTYHYRIFVYNTLGVCTGSKEESGTTLPPSAYFWDFENTQGGWVLDDPWYITDSIAHGGSHCLSDSPGTYADSASTSAAITVNLSSFVMP